MSEPVVLPNSLRSRELEAYYQEQKRNGNTKPLQEEEPLIQYKHWVVIKNSFPYDLVFSTHDMIIPRRKFAQEYEMNLVEQAELLEIKRGLKNQYNICFENLGDTRSVPDLFHLHLGVYKPRQS